MVCSLSSSWSALAHPLKAQQPAICPAFTPNPTHSGLKIVPSPSELFEQQQETRALQQQQWQLRQEQWRERQELKFQQQQWQQQQELERQQEIRLRAK
jgi:TolA-binding protein